jgi:NADH-quinone oxidoreductase subunit L
MTFVLLITFVGSLIHVYSLGYMEHDPDKRRFFAYLNLFVAAMLLLVLADSYLLLFVGWEGVGLASYLLIGFWNHNPAYATVAANKAFFVNRVGDLGLSIAIMLMFVTFGKVDFAGQLRSVAGASRPASPRSACCCCRRLRQVGPVPAAVLARRRDGRPDPGVRADPRGDDGHRRRLPRRALATRSSTPPRTPRLAVVIVGAITLLFGAIVGCAKDDIKKALAASTMSQIGYMMLAAGLGPIGYAFAIFHLLTHGFFKAGMFLGAGSVMHGMNDRSTCAASVASPAS